MHSLGGRVRSGFPPSIPERNPEASQQATKHGQTSILCPAGKEQEKKKEKREKEWVHGFGTTACFPPWDLRDLFSEPLLPLLDIPKLQRTDRWSRRPLGCLPSSQNDVFIPLGRKREIAEQPQPFVPATRRPDTPTVRLGIRHLFCAAVRCSWDAPQPSGIFFPSEGSTSLDCSSMPPSWQDRAPAGFFLGIRCTSALG